MDENMLPEIGDLVFSLVVGYLGALEFLYVVRHLYHWSCDHAAAEGASNSAQDLQQLQQNMREKLSEAEAKEAAAGTNVMKDGVLYTKDGFRIDPAQAEIDNLKAKREQEERRKQIEAELAQQKKIEEATRRQLEEAENLLAAQKKEEEQLKLAAEKEAEENAQKLLAAERQREEEQRRKEEEKAEQTRKLIEAEKQREDEQRRREAEAEQQKREIEERERKEAEERKQKEAEAANLRQIEEDDNDNERRLLEAEKQHEAEQRLLEEEEEEEEEEAAANERRLLAAEQQIIDNETIAELTDELINAERARERKQRMIEENAKKFLEAEQEMVDMLMSTKHVNTTRASGGSTNETPVVEEPCIKKHFHTTTEAPDEPVMIQKVKTQFGQSSGPQSSLATKTLHFPGLSDEGSSIDPLSSQQSSFGTQASDELNTSRDFSATHARQDPDGEDTSAPDVQYTEDYLRSLDGIKQRSLQREDGSGRRRAFKKRRSSGSSTSSRESRASREEEVRMFTSLEEDEMQQSRKESDYSPIKYSSEPLLKVRGHQKRHKRSPAKDAKTPDGIDNGRNPLDMLDEEQTNPWGEILPEPYKHTEFWQRKKAMSIDEEEIEIPGMSDQIHKTTSFEEASNVENEEALNALRQQLLKEDLANTERDKAAASINEDQSKVDTNLERSSASPRLRRSPRINTMDTYEEHWKDTNPNDSKSESITPQNTPTISIQAAGDTGPWRDQYGLMMEGLSDFYDFTASVNPSRSRSASRNPSPAKSPEQMSHEQAKNAAVATVEVYDDTGKIGAGEFCQANINAFLDSLSQSDSNNARTQPESYLSQSPVGESVVEAVTLIESLFESVIQPEVDTINQPLTEPDNQSEMKPIIKLLMETEAEQVTKPVFAAADFVVQNVADDASQHTENSAAVRVVPAVFIQGVTTTEDDSPTTEEMNSLVETLRMQRRSSKSRSRSRSPLPTMENVQRSLDSRRNKLIKHNDEIYDKLCDKMDAEKQEDTVNRTQDMSVPERSARSRSHSPLPTMENVQRSLESRRNKRIKHNDEIYEKLFDSNSSCSSTDNETSDETELQESKPSNDDDEFSVQIMENLVQTLRLERSRSHSRSHSRSPMPPMENDQALSTLNIQRNQLLQQNAKQLKPQSHTELHEMPTICIQDTEGELVAAAEVIQYIEKQAADILATLHKGRRSCTPEPEAVSVSFDNLQELVNETRDAYITKDQQRGRSRSRTSPCRSRSLSPKSQIAIKTMTETKEEYENEISKRSSRSRTPSKSVSVERTVKLDPAADLDSFSIVDYVEETELIDKYYNRYSRSATPSRSRSNSRSRSLEDDNTDPKNSPSGYATYESKEADHSHSTSADNTDDQEVKNSRSRSNSRSKSMDAVEVDNEEVYRSHSRSKSLDGDHNGLSVSLAEKLYSSSKSRSRSRSPIVYICAAASEPFVTESNVIIAGASSSNSRSRSKSPIAYLTLESVEESMEECMAAMEALEKTNSDQDLNDLYDFHMLLNLEAAKHRTLDKDTEAAESLLAAEQRQLDEEALHTLKTANEEVELRVMTDGKQLISTPDYNRSVSEEWQDFQRMKSDMLKSDFKRSTYVGESMEMGSEYEPLRLQAAKFQRSKSPSPSIDGMPNSARMEQRQKQADILDHLVAASGGTDCDSQPSIADSEDYKRSFSTEVIDTERIKAAQLGSGFKRSTYVGESVDLSRKSDQNEEIEAEIPLSELRCEMSEFRRSCSRSRSPLTDDELVSELAGIELEAAKRELQDRFLDDFDKTTKNFHEFSRHLNVDFFDNDRRASDSVLIQKPEILIQLQDSDVYADMEPEEYHHFRRFSLNQEQPVEEYPNDEDYLLVSQIEVRTLTGTRTWTRADFYSEDFEKLKQELQDSIEEEDEENHLEKEVTIIVEEELEGEGIVGEIVEDDMEKLSDDATKYELRENENLSLTDAQEQNEKIVNSEENKMKEESMQEKESAVELNVDMKAADIKNDNEPFDDDLELAINEHQNAELLDNELEVPLDEHRNEEFSDAETDNSEDERQTVVEVDDEIDTDITDFNERGPADESNPEQSECEEAERLVDHFADRDANDWLEAAHVEHFLDLGIERQQIDHQEGAIGGADPTDSTDDNVSFTIDEIYNDAIKNRKQSGILRDYDSILQEMQGHYEDRMSRRASAQDFINKEDERYALWAKTRELEKARNKQLRFESNDATKNMLEAERKEEEREMRYLGDANVAPGTEDLTQGDPNYKPRREYNWRKNFKLDEDEDEKYKDSKSAVDYGDSTELTAYDEESELLDAQQEFLDWRKFSLGGESVTLYSRNPEANEIIEEDEERNDREEWLKLEMENINENELQTNTEEFEKLLQEEGAEDFKANEDFKAAKTKKLKKSEMLSKSLDDWNIATEKKSKRRESLNQLDTITETKEPKKLKKSKKKTRRSSKASIESFNNDEDDSENQIYSRRSSSIQMETDSPKRKSRSRRSSKSSLTNEDVNNILDGASNGDLPASEPKLKKKVKKRKKETQELKIVEESSEPLVSTTISAMVTPATANALNISLSALSPVVKSKCVTPASIEGEEEEANLCNTASNNNSMSSSTIISANESLTNSSSTTLSIVASIVTSITSSPTSPSKSSITSSSSSSTTASITSASSPYAVSTFDILKDANLYPLF